jgi:hypothetical protein
LADTIKAMTPRLRLLPLASLAAALTLLAATPARAQGTLEQRGYRPVDPAVEDVDPLARSLRRTETGLRQIGEQHRIYTPVRPDGRSPVGRLPLYYVGQGVTAAFDRSQYDTFLVGRDRRPVTFHTVPPNTVFHLGLPPPPEAAPEAAPETPGISQYGLSPADDGPDYRINARVDGRSRPRFATPDGLAPSGPQATDPRRPTRGLEPAETPDARYTRLLAIQRQAVVGALLRRTGSDAD